MRRAISVVLCVCLFLCVLQFLHVQTSKDPEGSSTVKIIVGGGHGSGVNIGDGYIVTAAHVVGDAKTVKVKGHLPYAQLEMDAEVLWSNSSYDVALMRIGIGKMASSRLYCDDPHIGQAIEAVGNPGPLEFVHSYGHIASDVQERAHWKSTVIASLAIAPGSSGGPVLDMRGRLIGIVVGVALTNVGGFSPSAVALAYLVPASSICTLMARRA